MPRTSTAYWRNDLTVFNAVMVRYSSVAFTEINSLKELRMLSKTVLLSCVVGVNLSNDLMYLAIFSMPGVSEEGLHQGLQASRQIGPPCCRNLERLPISGRTHSSALLC